MKKFALEPWEQEISDAFDRGEFVSVSDSEKEAYRKIAESFAKKRKSISIRLSEQDLFRIKSKALAEGIPYQTYIASLIHKQARMER